MNNKLFENVFDKIQDGLPENWSKVAFYAIYTEGSYEMKYFVDCGSSEYIDCFSLEGMSKNRLIKLFMGIDKIISKERKTLPEGKIWTSMTMVVNDNGKVKTDFDYSDIADGVISYERSWKKKYLK